MNNGKVSMFMLERYRLGELSPEDQKAVVEALAGDENLGTSLKTLEESDRELLLRYPAEKFIEEIREGNSSKRIQIRRLAGRRTGRNSLRITGIAAVVMACILLPVLYFAHNIQGKATGQEQAVSAANSLLAGIPTDRAKGSLPMGCELALYLKEDQENRLEELTALSEGNTVQLAYTIPAGEQYGVIFSIDGRSEVTMHYPYRRGQSSLLVSGRKTFLDEAYTLDDAPGYEVFILVVSGEPLNVEAVLGQAKNMAGKMFSRFQATGSGFNLIDESKAAFPGCEVEILTVLKK